MDYLYEIKIQRGGCTKDIKQYLKLFLKKIEGGKNEKIIPILLVLTLVLTSCGSSKTGTGSADYKDVQEYNAVYSGEITTLNYLTTATTAEFSLAANFVDSLIDFDRYGVAVPCLATSWDESEDGLTWTLQIREGVKWHTYTGEEYADVTAHDWVDAAKYLLNPENESFTANIFMV